MLSGKPVGESVAEMLGGHVSFIERDDSNISRCSIAEWWRFYLDTVRRTKITGGEKKEHVFERKLEWFARSIGPLASTIIAGIGERAMMELMAMGYDRRSGEQQKMLDVYTFDTRLREDNKTAVLGSRIMDKIYKNWMKRKKQKRQPIPDDPIIDDWLQTVMTA
jgi:hypothetical protein